MSMLENLRKHLEETPEEQLKEEWKEVEEWGEVGPTVDEYLQFLEETYKDE